MAQNTFDNFQDYCVTKVQEGDRYASRFLKDGRCALELALNEARRKGLPDELIKRVEEEGMLDGSMQLTYEGAERIYDRVKQVVKAKGGPERDYTKLFDAFDPVADHDLIATGIFCIVPEVRKQVGDKLENLYRVVLNVGNGRRKGTVLPMRERYDPAPEDLLPPTLEKIIAEIPRAHTTEDERYQKMFNILLDEKARREMIPRFQQDKDATFSLLERRIAGEKNENLHGAYTRLQNNYRAYDEISIPEANPDFEDPETGEKGVLPSFHQKMTIYHLLEEKKYGIFHGCGTGKTAIGVLAKPLIERAMRAEGKELGKILIVGSNSSKKTWRKGLLGDEKVRYLREVQDAVIIDSDMNNKEILQNIEDHQWIVINYEQLITNVGNGKLLVDVLLEQGFDYVMFDESHRIKGRQSLTKNGRPTISAAARMLGHSAKYLALITGSPTPDGLKDYAVPYHLLNPELCPNIEDFDNLYEGNPRVLYTMFHEKAMRITSETLNHNLNWEEHEDLIELDPLQRKIYDHIVETRPQNWMIQARKALLDPRLVDPEILKATGTLGKVTILNSAKYKWLEEILTGPDSPLLKDEKFVIFSSTFRDGVTTTSDEFRRRYHKLGLDKEYKTLDFDTTVISFLTKAVKKKLGKDISIGIIDGTITDIEERERIVGRIGKDLDGIMATTETGGESLDMTAANHMYFLDDDYVPKTKMQGISREIRKGQRKTVDIRYGRGRNTLDESLRDYVDKKDILNKIATDGYPLTDDEKALLEDSGGKRFSDLVKSGLGGVSINVFDADIESVEDFELKRRVIRQKAGGTFGAVCYDTTDAQKVMQWIGKDPLNCWKDPEFVTLYMKAMPNLAVPIMHRAKVCNLITRASRGEIEFPKTILSDGSGPSLLYNAYVNLDHLLAEQNIPMPLIYDRDLSHPMLLEGTNPRKIIGNMTGENSAFASNSFDMVDNESITLLRNPAEVKSSLLEASRVLRNGGLLELGTKNWRFANSFYDGLATLGFEVLTRKDEGFAVSKSLLKKIRQFHGEHFAESYADKLSGTFMLLAKKIGEPEEAEAKNFWFESMRGEPITVVEPAKVIISDMGKPMVRIRRVKGSK